MIAVAGLWELGWNTPIKEVDLWQYPLRDFGVERFYMTPVSGINSRHVIERPALHDILAECAGLTAVFVDERAEVPLPDLDHPSDALYLFGKANYSPFLSMRRDGDMAVSIPTAANRGMLWPHQAAAIVLYDRLVKSWR